MERTTELIRQHGGDVLDVVRAIDVLEGKGPEGALSALVRFPDLDALQAFSHTAGGADFPRFLHARLRFRATMQACRNN